MSLLDIIRLKKLVEKVESPISGEVLIFKALGGYSLEVGGLEQSGGFIAGIWRKALRKARKFKSSNVQSVLILGLGGGTAAKLVSQSWSKAKITGVEIDPVIIKLAKKYFSLGDIPHLKIFNLDAIDFLKRKGIFDLILVDVYLADQVPQTCQTEEFLKMVRSRLAPGGLAVFNRLYYQEKKKETELFIKRLKKFFSRLSFVRTSSNLLIFVDQ